MLRSFKKMASQCCPLFFDRRPQTSVDIYCNFMQGEPGSKNYSNSSYSLSNSSEEGFIRAKNEIEKRVSQLLSYFNKLNLEITVSGRLKDKPINATFSTLDAFAAFIEELNLSHESSGLIMNNQ